MKPEILKLGKTPIELGLPITSISIDLTERCNLRCEYCFCDLDPIIHGQINNKPTDKNLDLTLDLGKEIIDWFVKEEVSGKEPALSLTFWGGEPLLKFDLMKELTSYAQTKERKINFEFTTNITLLTEEILNWCFDNDVHFLLSCDGVENSNSARKLINGNNSWDIIKEKLALIKKIFNEKNLPLPNFRLTVNKYNIDKFGKDIIYFYEYGFHEIFFSENYDEVWPDNYFKLYAEQILQIINYRIKEIEENRVFLKSKFIDEALRHHFDIQNNVRKKLEHSCGAGRHYFAVSTEGALYPCHRLNKHNTQDKNWQDKDLNLGSIWENITNEELYNQITNLGYLDKGLKNTKCENCKYILICRGGCLAAKHDVNKDIHIPEKINCRLKEIIWNAALYEKKIIEQNENILNIYLKALYPVKQEFNDFCTCNASKHINIINNIKHLLKNNKLQDISEENIEILNILFLLQNHIENKIKNIYTDKSIGCICYSGQYSYELEKNNISAKELEEILNIYNVYNNLDKVKVDG